MGENYFLFRNACWFKSLYLYKFQGKSKVSKNQGKCERRGISRTRERMRWTERMWQHKGAASESHVMVSDMYSVIKWNSWISVDFLPFSCRKQILKRTAIKLSRCIILQFIFQETDFIFFRFYFIFWYSIIKPVWESSLAQCLPPEFHQKTSQMSQHYINRLIPIYQTFTSSIVWFSGLENFIAWYFWESWYHHIMMCITSSFLLSHGMHMLHINVK